jgi:hypothetical protein
MAYIRPDNADNRARLGRTDYEIFAQLTAPAT